MLFLKFVIFMPKVKEITVRDLDLSRSVKGLNCFCFFWKILTSKGNDVWKHTGWSEIIFWQTSVVGKQLWYEFSISKKSCRIFYWRKKKWEKQKFGSYETVDNEIGLHRSPKCSSMIVCVCYAFLQLHLPGFVKIWRIAPSVVKNTSNLDFEIFLFFLKKIKIFEKIQKFQKIFFFI